MLPWFKEFLYFSKEERRGILLLLAAVLLALSALLFRTQREEPASPGEAARQDTTASVAGYEAFRASQKRQGERRTRQTAYPQRKEMTPVRLVAFDPNTADSATFRSLGLPAWMARNIVRYREKGGKFRRAEDFKKIYGMTEERFLALLPYIAIPTEKEEEGRRGDAGKGIKEDGETQGAGGGVARSGEQGRTDEEVHDTLYRRFTPVPKYPAGTVLSLNHADTTELKRIPGIGSHTARRIVEYRRRLGGFYSIGQLHDIRLDTLRLAPWFRIDSSAVRLIDLNRAGIERLMSHPYINFYQAKVLVEYRKKHGKVQSLKPFVLYEEFTEADLARIRPYLSFQ